MLNRIEKPLGYGEREPLVIKLRNAGEVLLGDNDSPVGRFYNRRISVLLYREN
jgi:flagellar motor protein MotB